MHQLLFKRGVYPLAQAKAIHQDYKRLVVSSFQPILESTDSTYVVALVMVADHKELLKELREPARLQEVVQQKAILFAHPKANRYRLLVLYELVDQAGQYHYQDLFHLLEQLHLPFQPEKYLWAA